MPYRRSAKNGPHIVGVSAAEKPTLVDGPGNNIAEGQEGDGRSHHEEADAPRPGGNPSPQALLYLMLAAYRAGHGRQLDRSSRHTPQTYRNQPTHLPNDP